MNRVLPVAGLMTLVLVLAACAAGANPALGVAPEGDDVAGFWVPASSSAAGSSGPDAQGGASHTAQTRLADTRRGDV